MPNNKPNSILNTISDVYATAPYFESMLETLNAISGHHLESLSELEFQSVSGGDINEASIVTLPNAEGEQISFFLKRNRIENADILFAEAIGLSAMRQAQIRTCQPLAMGVDSEMGCAFLLLSMIYRTQNNKRRPASANTANKASGWEDLAVQLAHLHLAAPPQPNELAAAKFDKCDGATAACHSQAGVLKASQSNSSDSMDSDLKASDAKASDYASSNEHRAGSCNCKGYAGFFVDNFIGSNPQINSWTTDWHAFFAEYRLGLQTKWAYDNQRISRNTLKQLERLQHKLAQYLPNYALTDERGTPRPSLLHGDLWSGNAMIGNASENADEALGFLIDPAVYVGHPETDIAMTRMFGGFSEAFYDAYAQHCPLESGFTERQDIYNLYHYLNHLNLFGSGYLSAVERIAKRFGH